MLTGSLVLCDLLTIFQWIFCSAVSRLSRIRLFWKLSDELTHVGNKEEI
jgi:hypothetical protein